ncbi:MAG: hypothetical protein AAGD22_00270 [Verrucomicrobiota bacterium]
MEDRDLPEELEPIGPIPPELYSEYEERPFKSCTRCGESLADFEEGYRVSKVHRAGEVLFEYALCGPCFLNIYEESSDKTKVALYQYQRERLRHDVISGEQCALCGQPKNEIENAEYALVGACHGENLLDINLVCGACIEEMNQLVSKQTRDVWDRFVQDNFPGVPADFEPVPSDSTPFLV